MVFTEDKQPGSLAPGGSAEPELLRPVDDRVELGIRQRIQ